MATKLFNFTNQRLNAEKLREVQAFNSSDFGGIISRDLVSPFSISDNTVILDASENSPVTFLGGGLILNQTEQASCSFINNKTLWYLEVELNSNVANITTDELIVSEDPPTKSINFKSTLCDSLTIDKTYTYFTPVFEAQGSPKNNQYYEYSTDTYILSEDESVDSTKTYYLKIEASRLLFTASYLSTSTFSYFGNTIWISPTVFIIPLFAYVDDDIVQAVTIRDIGNFESLISMESFAKLKTYADGTFVWSIGGMEPIMAPDGTSHRKGDIGKLNITDDTIYNIEHADDSTPNYNTPVKIQNLTINSISNENNNAYTKLIVDKEGNISTSLDYIESVYHGGTGANNRSEAKTNLGIFYGDKNPKTSSPTNIPQEGDIYLWIIE